MPDVEQAPSPRRSPGLRVALYLLAMLVLRSFGTALLLLLIKGPEFLQKIATPADAEKLISLQLLMVLQAALLPAVLVATLLFTVVVDKKPLAAIGLSWPPGTLRALGAGVLLAVIGIGGWRAIAGFFATFVEKPFDAAELEKMSPMLPLEGWSLGLMVIGLLAIALLEELMFRGYIFSAFREHLPWVHAAGLTTLLYGLFMTLTPAQGPAALVNTFLLGMLLAAVRERTGALWPGMLLQTGWNLLLGSFLSLRVSGLDFPRYSNIEVQGAEAITGGEYGPEGSWLMTGLLLGLVALAAFWVERGRPQQKLPPDMPVAG
jgi:membrane protease YdiL (CAAX protease family)